MVGLSRSSCHKHRYLSIPSIDPAVLVAAFYDFGKVSRGEDKVSRGEDTCQLHPPTYASTLQLFRPYIEIRG
jgi:hypothetical protein